MTHPAASNPTSTSTTAITGVTTVAIPVADQERSLAFFSLRDPAGNTLYVVEIMPDAAQ